MKLLKIIFGLFIALFLLSGVIVILLPILGITFGLIGAVFGLIWKIVTHPVVLIVFVAVLAFSLYKKSRQ
jgi:hypothetical protein